MKGCNQCNISTFDSRGSKEWHNKKWHKNYTIKLNNSLITITPNYHANGFVCYLKSGYCQEVSSTIEELVSHMRGCTGKWVLQVCQLNYYITSILTLGFRNILLQYVKCHLLNPLAHSFSRYNDRHVVLGTSLSLITVYRRATMNLSLQMN